MQILVTGATGVIGQRAIPLLAAAGHRITAAVRDPHRATHFASLGASVVALDLFDRSAVRRALEGHDAVVNLATHIPASLATMFLPWSWRENDRIRRDASRIVAECAVDADVSRYVQESFAPVYPDRGDAWIAEETPIAPVAYNRSVADAERSAEWFTSRGGTGIVLRFAAFYGRDHMLETMAATVRRGWSPLPGAPDAFFSSVSWEDAAAAVAAVLDAPAGTYNVADDRPLRRREYVDSLARAIGAPPPRFPPRWTTKLMGSLGGMLARSLRISNRKLRETTGWAPKWRSAADAWPSLLSDLHA